ncbi:MAG: TlpA family protein disulfide reductase [Gammaproteobacteria bacterium]|nr:TlpA family protein disulfide reductase [Gammaproteobacteria bacterium]MBT8150562.1 TlpA family protein disulfide reductase [Gammaproteobacteria bacterium]NND38340.1 TlpA family protein disulfide reductase [Pseudomonadales bacterium]NNM12330.1 TlpA family protein disulfide reductase [Pseudomonadales bacterium]
MTYSCSLVSPPLSQQAQIVLRSVLLPFILLLLLQGCGPKPDVAGDSPIAEFAGKWVLINYWAEWCVPCIKEIPELNALQQDHADTIKVLGVNFDRVAGQQLQTLAQQMGIGFLQLEQDPGDALRLSRPSALPATYLFNPSGELAAVLVGPQTTDSLLSRIQRLQQSTPADAR